MAEQTDSWVEDFFQGLWLDVQRGMHTAEQTAEYTGAVAELMGLEAGERVLDCPCGEGRISRDLARQGLSVVGVDLTEALLETARERTAGTGLDVRYLQGDMRFLEDLGLDAEFDAVVNCWGSFGYFSDRENARVVQSWASVLKPGGRLFIDMPSHETIFPRYSPRAWHEVNGVLVLEDRAYDPRTSVMATTWTLIRGSERFVKESHIRIHTGHEMIRLLEAAGFAEVELYGDFDGSEFRLNARRQLVVGRMPE